MLDPSCFPISQWHRRLLVSVCVCLYVSVSVCPGWRGNRVPATPTTTQRSRPVDSWNPADPQRARIHKPSSAATAAGYARNPQRLCLTIIDGSLTEFIDSRFSIMLLVIVNLLLILYVVVLLPLLWIKMSVYTAGCWKLLQIPPVDFSRAGQAEWQTVPPFYHFYHLLQPS